MSCGSQLHLVAAFFLNLSASQDVLIVKEGRPKHSCYHSWHCRFGYTSIFYGVFGIYKTFGLVLWKKLGADSFFFILWTKILNRLGPIAVVSGSVSPPWPSRSCPFSHSSNTSEWQPVLWAQRHALGSTLSKGRSTALSLRCPSSLAHHLSHVAEQITAPASVHPASWGLDRPGQPAACSCWM